MKYLLFALFGHFVALSYAQTSELNQATKLINSFQTEKNIELLEQARDVVSELFEKKEFRPDANALYTKAKVMSLLLQNQEQDDPLAYSETLKNLYSEALEKDESMNLRYDILSELYLSKAKLLNLGNAAYELSDYPMAHSLYKNALKLNALEVAYPKHTKLDTSILFTSAVFAKLGDKNKEAIADFERLAENNYNRVEVYDYLIELYRKEGQEEKIDRIQKLKEKRFPE